MKLRNKRTGEIIDADFNATISGRTNIIIIQNGPEQLEYNSLAELNDEWEDYEEPKNYWTIDWTCTGVTTNKYSGDDVDDFNKSIGNYFDTKEEAEKAVEKLKAWKRLKDHNLRVERGQRIFVNADNKLTSQKPLFVVDTYEEVEDDLDLLFGGEE